MIDNLLLSNLINYNKSRYLSFKNGCFFEKDEHFERLLCARYMKVSRIKKRIVFLLSRFKYCYFCTFTFDNNYLSRTDRTKKDLIKHTINNFSSDVKYILNIDYGKKTEREHYHAIVCTNNSLNFRSYLKKYYPFLSGADLINNSKDDFIRLSKYINKLTNHAIKSTVKNSRIYYNFKGYEAFCPTSYDVTTCYILDLIKLGWG